MAEEEPAAAPPGRPALVSMPTWVWDPTATIRARGFSTADLLVFPGRLVVQPRKVAVRLVRLPRLEYSWPTVVVQHLVLSYRLNFPHLATVLLDLDGQLASAWVPFWKRRTLAGVLRSAGFDVVEVVHRGWEAPAPVDAEQRSQLRGRVPVSVLGTRS